MPIIALRYWYQYLEYSKCTETTSSGYFSRNTEQKAGVSTQVQLFGSITTYTSKLFQEIQKSSELSMILDPALSKPFNQCSS